MKVYFERRHSPSRNVDYALEICLSVYIHKHSPILGIQFIQILGTVHKVSNQQARDGRECGKKQIDDKCVDSLIEEPERKTPFDKPRRRWEDGRPTKANIQEM